MGDQLVLFAQPDAHGPAGRVGGHRPRHDVEAMEADVTRGRRPEGPPQPPQRRAGSIATATRVPRHPWAGAGRRVPGGGELVRGVDRARCAWGPTRPSPRPTCSSLTNRGRRDDRLSTGRHETALTRGHRRGEEGPPRRLGPACESIASNRRRWICSVRFRIGFLNRGELVWVTTAPLRGLRRS